jgi:hypothetical protein
LSLNIRVMLWSLVSEENSTALMILPFTYFPSARRLVSPESELIS